MHKPILLWRLLLNRLARQARRTASPAAQGRHLSEKVQNVEACRKHVQMRDICLESKPLEIQLEVTTRCNLWCIMCATTFDGTRGKLGHTGHMAISVLDNLRSILPSVARCYVFGNGEPLLHPRFMDFIKVIKGYGVRVEFNTNGTLLNVEMREAMVSWGVDAITFSIDGATAGTYESIRRGSKFDTVIANIRALTELKMQNSQTIPHLGIAMVAMKNNVAEFATMVTLAADLGVSCVHLEPLIWQADPVYQRFYVEYTLSNLDPGAVTAMLEQAWEMGARYGIHVTSQLFDTPGQYDYPSAIAEARGLHPQNSTSARQPPDLICTEPWTTIFIKWNGEVRTCCGSPTIFGDLSREKIEDIWNNKRYQSYRRNLAQNNPPPECLNCIKNGRPRQIIPQIVNLLS